MNQLGIDVLGVEVRGIEDIPVRYARPLRFWSGLGDTIVALFFPSIARVWLGIHGVERMIGYWLDTRRD